MFLYILNASWGVDLEFLWMIMERFGVNLSSHDSVLPITIDGKEKMLPVQKVILNSTICNTIASIIHITYDFPFFKGH